MPKRTDIKKILILGAGPIVIGQACEFDYSGTQACKALREEGFEVVLVNSNPATIMTDPEMADRTYIEPITPGVVEQIIAVERPDALLPTLGGQTGLNVGLALAESGVLERLGCQLIGASAEAIRMAEDRALFKIAMSEIGLDSARSALAHSLDEARVIRDEIGLPLRPPPQLHHGRLGGRDRLQQGRVRPDGRLRARTLAGQDAARRGVPDRLERVRDGGDARLRRQRRHRLLDRELRPDGRSTPATASPSPRRRR